MRPRPCVAIFALAVGAHLALAVPASADNIDYAKMHFGAGSAYYEEGHYEEAIKEFREAFRLSRKPVLLYDIARCHERLGRPAEAAMALKEYLVAAPYAADRGAVAARVVELERQAAAATPAGIPPSEPPRPRRVATWVVGGAGFALLGAALATYMVALRDLNHLRDACDANGRCPAEKQAEHDEGQALATTSYVLFAAGGAAVATSVVLFFVEGRKAAAAATSAAPPKASFAPLILPGGGGLVARLRF